MDKMIQNIIEGVSNTRGTDFLNAITLKIAEAIGASYTFIATLDRQKNACTTNAVVSNGLLRDNIEYSLLNTPSANVIADAICCYPSNVTELFPDDNLLIVMNIKGYLGIPLHDSNGQVMGLIVALYENPVNDTDFAQSLFQIFSGRIAAELEKNDYENKLIDLNKTLELKVLERTADLNSALSSLEDAQEKLIESEKISALGTLVAGVAHEVNTPLGIAITGHSLVSEAFIKLINQLDDNSLSKDQMTEFRITLTEALPLIESNLSRAKNLINNFKNIAADQNTQKQDTIQLSTYYDQVISTLSPLLKRHSIQLSCNIPSNIVMTTIPGIHAQILTNLISNSALHAFQGITDRQIAISVGADEDQIRVLYTDNGNGLGIESRERIFEPFYTTARMSGGTGLGMSIIFNLIKQKLFGDISLNNTEQGFSVTIILPAQ